VALLLALLLLDGGTTTLDELNPLEELVPAEELGVVLLKGGSTELEEGVCALLAPLLRSVPDELSSWLEDEVSGELGPSLPQDTSRTVAHHNNNRGVFLIIKVLH